MSRGPWRKGSIDETNLIQERILDIIEPDLNTVGFLIRTGDIWRKYNGISYGKLAANVKRIMDLLLEQRKVKKHKQGQWIVIKPNERKR